MSGQLVSGISSAAQTSDVLFKDSAYDTVIIGAGPAGLSAALNLARARRHVLVLDANRPRNAATLLSHGFLTRDGIAPHELRRLAREELAEYPEAELQLATVLSVNRIDNSFAVDTKGINGSPSRRVAAKSILIATGLKETLPALPSIRGFYGLGLFSCVECDGYGFNDRPLALIGETSDLASRALLIAQWSNNLIVFTNGANVVTPAQQAVLAERGVRVERRPVADVEGARGVVSGIRLMDGTVIAVEGGFVRPYWDAALDYASTLGLKTDGWGLVATDADGRTNVAGLYAAGDSTAPGPQQLIVAAGAGARAAAAINRDLIGIPRH